MKTNNKAKSILAILFFFLVVSSPAQNIFSAAAVGPFQPAFALALRVWITSITDSNADNVGTIGEMISIHGFGFGTTGATVTIGKAYGQPVSAVVVQQTPTRIDAIVPAGIDTGAFAVVDVKIGLMHAKKNYPVNRLLVYVTNTRTYGLQILNADTLLPVGPAFNFDVLGVVDGDGSLTAPLDVAINATGETAYIVLKKRIYLMDLIQKVINTAAPINFTDAHVLNAHLSPNENYVMTHSMRTNIFFPFTSRIGPLPAGTTQTFSLPLQTDLAIAPDQSFTYLVNSNKLAKIAIEPNYSLVTNPAIGSGQPLNQIAIAPNSSKAFVSESLSANDQVHTVALPSLTPGVVLPVPGKVNDLATTVPSAAEILVADCVNNQVHRVNTTNGMSSTLALNECPYHLEVPLNGKYAYIGRRGSNFILPPSYVSAWNLASNQIGGTHQDNNAVLVNLASQR